MKDKKTPLFLVALDGSPRAQHVLETAVDIARARGASLVLLRAVGMHTPVHPQGSDDGDMLDDTAHKDLARAAQDLPAGLVAQQIVKTGVPWDAIVHEAKEIGADLVVIGSHGYSGLDRLLGTTAAKVVDHAPCSVLVVKPPAQ